MVYLHLAKYGCFDNTITVDRRPGEDSGMELTDKVALVTGGASRFG